MAPSTLLHLCFCIIYTAQTCCGFNVDVRFPVIKEGKTKGSFFGFSVAQHRLTEKPRKYLLLAGAPKEKALSQLKVNETGAIYSCPITTETTDCTRVDLITSTDSSEMIEGMWLGVTVASQREHPGGRVLACGHRYVKIVQGRGEEQRRMVGKCFVRGNDLSFDRGDLWQDHPYEVCNPNTDMELEGMCNMGISAGMTDSDVYIGCTGSFEWQGNVHVTWRDTTPDNSWDYSEKDFGSLNKRNSYMGYSVTEDLKLLSRKEYTVVTGAPRDDSRGSVMLAVKGQSNLEPAFIIPGEQVGSYFGSSVAVTDLNNDDWNDLIVGAPFYFDRYKEQGGAVYVFINENGSFQNKSSIVLNGAKGSAFGFAVAAIGDVNQDGFQDIAVGAPFHDSGKVYIWMGSKEGITNVPSQVIEGKTLGSGGFQTFGYSLSGGMDMDGNKYPDILVGSLDDRIALLRARPVIHLSRNFTVEPKIVDPSQCIDTCITATMCFTYTLSNGNRSFKKGITVKYTVEADRNRRGPRVQFINGKSTYTGLLSFSSPTCQELKLRINEQITNKLEPVVFLLNVSLNEASVEPEQTLQDLDTFPMLSSQQQLTEKTEINFQKECGSDNKCSSNLQVTAQFANELQIVFPSVDGRQTMEYNSSVRKVMLLVEVSNIASGGREAEDAHQALLNITVPPTLSYSGFRSKEIECNANKTVMCDVGNPFKSNKKISFQIIFETFITLYTDEIVLQLQLSTLSEQNDLYPVPVVLNVENTILTSFSIENPVVNTYFSGKVVGESAMNSTDDIGSLVEYVLQVSVAGEPLGTLGTLVVDFSWPFEVTNGKWLLYLTEILTGGTSESHCVPPGKVINHLNLTMSRKSLKRQKRDLDNSLPLAEAAKTLLTPRKETHLLDCAVQTARCVTFSCPLRNMSTAASLTVRARVWNSTMLEDFANTFRVIVKGNATLRLETDKPTIKMQTENREFVLNIDPVPGEETPYNVPLWIYIIAGIAGIILLGIISFILWKCGFFKRASRREMYEAKAQKAEMKIQPSENDKLTEDY
ncbi:integrin alpha-3b isoform X2 [Tachysurus fulvidraco]|uniref:integrin alpha-3b isoform X2 n=1 Tax=Tachysurus fulvidraco TaxID=1234273 RepID=UPI001FEDBB23|nr:integrin alpha-3b isoform X2 [Tachysurus fulvidraco]